MVGVTLSPEQIRRAPPEVRRWLQGEIAASLGVELDPAPSVALPHLWACSPQDAAAIFARISGVLPVVNVFFELGRQGEFVTAEGLVAHRLVDMLRHTRLESMEQLSACLEMVIQAARELTKDPEIALYLIDQRGYCLVPVQTQKSIAEVWRQLVSRPAVAEPPVPAEAAQRASPLFPSMHGALPPKSAHLGFAAPGTGA